MTIVFDIETVPAVDLSSIAHLAAKREQDPELFASLCPVLCRVVCVGMLHAETGRSASFCDEDEARMLTDAFAELSQAARIVTFNGRRFDIPVLLHRAAILGIAPAPILKRAAWAKPWESDMHVDVLSLMTFGGAASRYSLETYCRGYGIENPKANGDGSAVAALWRDGRVGELVAYCMADVRATAALWERVR